MDLFSPKCIQEILSKHGFHFSKSLGQNFLTERRVCEQIVSMSDVDKNDSVLEIGPGLGSLTSVLAESAKKVVSVEIDKSLLPVLDETLNEYDNVKIINQDILKCDLRKLIDDEFNGEKPKVCANLPYYITTPIISHLIEASAFSSLTTMVQKEVADRICANAGDSDYGAFSVFVQYYTEPESLFVVEKECFIPQPKVQSAVIRLNIRETPAVSPDNEKHFFRVVKAAFAQRRKQLANSLLSGFKTEFDKSEILDILTTLGHKPTVRGEELTIYDFCDISNKMLSEYNKKTSAM